MPVSYKDYYKILGVQRDASADQIKRAFRDLARKYHPDKVRPEQKEASEEKFKEINEAYEVLKSPEKRKLYDAYGENWESVKVGSGGFPDNQSNSSYSSGAGGYQSYRHGAGGRGFEYHFEGTGFSDFFEHLFGRRGMEGDAAFNRMRGGSASYSARGGDVEGELLVTLNEVLHGAKRRVSFFLRNPQRGSEEKRDFNVHIPIGVRDGQRLRIAGLGEAGFGSGPAGDLYLRVRYAEHPDMRVQGQDLYYELSISPWEGTLGAKVNVNTLEETLRINIRPGTPSGQKLRVRGKGLPDSKGNRGDLFVILQIVCPEHLNSQERDLWEKLAKTSRFNPRN